ncbi:MAG: AGC family serine/threonine-protein kinase [Kangiellaceae bacterium]|jgi:protein-serine/threonine kinase|nr:AGC family serine/threonine-protein kinase [Kangiellaceae bacterium]
MKVLDKDKIFKRNLMKYVLSEKDVLSQVDHPFIVKMHHSFQNGEKLFLILDYCPNGDLSFHLKRERFFTEQKARLYLSEVVLAIEALHSHDIIYRDLKPDNIVLDAEGHCLLTDFGLSKAEVGEEQHTYSFCGSVAYLPPEILNKGGHGKAVDWYLVGTLLYEMLIGQPPYYAETKDAIFKNIKYAKLKFPNSVNRAARDLITALMQRNPACRLSTAEEVKAHPFFTGVEWERVLARQQLMPKTTPIRYAQTAFDIKEVFAEGDGAKVNGWSFNAPPPPQRPV